MIDIHKAGKPPCFQNTDDFIAFYNRFPPVFGKGEAWLLLLARLPLIGREAGFVDLPRRGEFRIGPRMELLEAHGERGKARL